jgi:hypothetical protein
MLEALSWMVEEDMPNFSHSTVTWKGHWKKDKPAYFRTPEGRT